MNEATRIDDFSPIRRNSASNFAEIATVIMLFLVSRCAKHINVRKATYRGGLSNK